MELITPEWCMPSDEPPTNDYDPRYDMVDSLEWTKIPLEKPKRSAVMREHDLAQYENMFFMFMPQVAGGVPLTTVMKEDYRCIEQGRFMRWINKDIGRRAEYEQAMEAGVELLMQETIEIADNADEDVNRSALRIKTRQQLAAKYKPKLFGDSKQIDITTKNLDREGLKAMTATQLRELLADSQDNTIDAEYTDVSE